MFKGVLRHIRRQPVAFVALFFALGGGAMAASNFIKPTDTIPSGDLAGSTYGNPLIASGKVTTGKLADGSVTTGKFASDAEAPNAAKLDGLGSSAFLPATKVQGDGTVTLQMPASSGDTNQTTLISDGPLTVVGQCTNSGGVPEATVGVQNTIEAFVAIGSAEGRISPAGVFVPTATTPLAQATASGGLPVWDIQRRDFSVVGYPSSGSHAIQGSATAITQGQPATNECFLAAWGFAS
jgi:hypothetical protein